MTAPYGWPGYPPPPPPPRPPLGRPPVRIEPVPGTDFALAYPPVPPTVSGLAIGAMVVGIGSVLVTTAVFCFGVTGAKDGWGALVAGAFAILAGLAGGAALAGGLVAGRQIRASAGRLSGRGMAVAGVTCGATGIGLTVLGFLTAVLLG